MSPVLSVRDLRVSFASEAGRVDAVRGVSFDLEAGKTLGIVGESGSGKSVTSLAVMGLLDENAKVTGSIVFDGQELLGKTDTQLSAIRGNGISMVFQDPLTSLTPVYTIGAQLIEALTVHRNLSIKEATARSIDLLKLVGITEPEKRMKSFPHEFSGGMRQRVVIAIAMANDPKLIIADEPTTALDVTIQAQILDLIEKAQAETGAAVMMITHDMGVVARTADDVMVMYAGKPVEQAPVRELFHQTRMPYSIGLLGAIPRVDKAEKEPLTPIKGNPPLLINLPDACPFADRCPIVMDACRTREPELLPVLTGGGEEHRAACIRANEITDGGLLGGLPVYPVREAPESELTRLPREERPITLEVKNLTKTFPLLKGAFLKRKVGEVHAIKGISFDVREGETLAIVGESGSGKTTTLLQIMDMVKQTDGDIVIAGTSVNDIHSHKVERALRRDIQIVFQDPMGALDPRMTVADIISEPLSAIGTPKAEAHRRVKELMDLVGLNPAHSDRFPQAFSGGQRQRIGIARALSTNPKILVLDEPVSALDVSIQAGVINLLDDLKVKLGLSYLFVAHDLSVVRHIADRVAVMYLGDFVEHGDVDDVFDNPQHPYTKALLSAIPVPDPDIERTRERIVFDPATVTARPAAS
ncbi:MULTISPECIES: ABC transporter ATP-binding protein [unclassified Microbacterium]|uniref:ABC transporter ATP-binding protein n=1 Tax=unclassified Microbacterium TaxID=2609290 RepID=UPI00049376A1|nr:MULTISPECIES: ABC transporter ATP-binding protein [unclassified Microbacterium]MCV0335074.1 ABC transporter ATP-binding protein [Microbacterium sp.]MCV0375177.1 ABC transporter ATP-binding protein [Microbacterium sp.]MCV0388304.1 ABC transporter ATP-binding protein [Microbacterium sp.]MCV0416831.1 ABC transporter ATP-binding protein [Microbacterium sp.]MCV0423444.1 ABC transporter ATP-binding protein [Microbacterium sp.]